MVLISAFLSVLQEDNVIKIKAALRMFFKYFIGLLFKCKQM